METLLVFAFALITGFVLGYLFSRYEIHHRMKETGDYLQQALSNMETKFRVLANEILDSQKEKLENENNSHLDLVLKPLHDNLDRLDKVIHDVNEKSIQHHTSFQDAINRLGEQTLSIGREADNLARALKNETKIQGDWGEMVL